MNDNSFQLPDDISDEMIEEAIDEQEQWRKQVESYLWENGYKGCRVVTYGGLIFISNITKTPEDQLKWLKRYSEVLHDYGIKAEVFADKDSPYICF